MDKEITQTFNVDSDDDVIFVETQPIDYEVITLSDDETQKTCTSSNTVLTPIIPNFSAVHQIKKETNPTLVSTPVTFPQQYISSLQLFSQNPLANVFEVLKKVNVKSQIFNKYNKRNKKIRKLRSKLKPNNNLQKNSENKNTVVSNQPQVNIQKEKPTVSIQSTDSSRNNNLNEELENTDIQGNTSNQTVDVVNEPQAEDSYDSNKTESNIESMTVVDIIPNELQNGSTNQNEVVMNETQSGSSYGIERSGLNIESQSAITNNGLPDDLISQNVINKSQTGPNFDMENTIISLPNNSVEVPIGPKPNDVTEMNTDENPQVEQCTTSNNFQQISNPRQDNNKLMSGKNMIFTKAEFFDPLLSVIVEEGYPDVRYLTEYHLLTVRKLVGFEIDNELSNGTFIPRFQRSYVKNGVILVRSADIDSQKWLQRIVPMLNPGPGVRLMISSPQDLNKTFKIKIRIFHDTSMQQIITRIQKQNPDINTRSWQLQSVQRFKGDRPGVILHMVIPASSVKFLENREFKLHYGLYQVEVEIKDASYKKKC